MVLCYARVTADTAVLRLPCDRFQRALPRHRSAVRGIVRRAATVEERHTWVMLNECVVLCYARVAADTAVLRRVRSLRRSDS
ncbi:MAG: hypothetical protein ACR2LR_20975 [Hassallia sp.]